MNIVVLLLKKGNLYLPAAVQVNRLSEAQLAFCELRCVLRFYTEPLVPQFDLTETMYGSL
ncbi:MAG: hypothetical protein M3014_05705 [Chloroflexota bacterium]|nr:hypothetical protein [Chloroflexota bacterium]